jgi:hypothetical protein
MRIHLILLIKRKRLREKTTERRGKRWNLSLIFEMSQHCHKKSGQKSWVVLLIFLFLQADFDNN